MSEPVDTTDRTPDPAVDVTIVIPTRDRSHLLPRAVASALAQTHPSIEIIVVDDGSTVPVAVAPANSKVRIIRHRESRGPCAARNAGLAVARGRWVTFLDDDDELAPDMVRRSLERLRSSPTPDGTAAITAIRHLDPQGNVVEIRRPPPSERLARPTAVSIPSGVHNTLIVPTAALRSIGGFDEELRAWMGTDLFLRLKRVCTIATIDDPLYTMHEHSGVRRHRDHLAVAESIRRTLRKNSGAVRLSRSRRGAYESEIARNYLRAGRWLPAAVAATRALWLRPTRGVLLTWMACAAGPQIHRIRKRMS